MLGAAPQIAETDLALIKNIALLFFFAIFVLILLRLVFTRPDRYAHAARIPLDDLDPEPLTTGTVKASAEPDGEPDHV